MPASISLCVKDNFLIIFCPVRFGTSGHARELDEIHAIALGNCKEQQQASLRDWREGTQCPKPHGKSGLSSDKGQPMEPSSDESITAGGVDGLPPCGTNAPLTPPAP